MIVIKKHNGVIAVHREYEPIEQCCNEDSYGMVCVRCNQCKRWDNDKVPPFYEEVKGAEKEKLEALFEEMFTGDINNDKKV